MERLRNTYWETDYNNGTIGSKLLAAGHFMLESSKLLLFEESR